MISQKSYILFVSVIFFILILQSWTKANDSIRDFQIEGMSIGDSALDYFTKSDIIISKVIIKIKSLVQNDFYDFLGLMMQRLSFKTGDTKYVFHNLSGVLSYQNNIQDCYLKWMKLV